MGGRTALHRPADQTSPSIGLTEEQDTPRHQAVLPREIGIVILLDNNNWSTYLHLTVNIGSDGIEMTINVKIF